MRPSPEYEELEAEVAVLKKRVDELLANNTKLVEERRLLDRRQMVMSFHRKYGHPVGEVPVVPSEAQVRFRLRLIAEEFCELLDACGIDAVTDPDEVRGYDVAHIFRCVVNAHYAMTPDLPTVADALGDLAYVIEGTNIVFGVDSNRVFNAIQESNMGKVPNGLAKPTKPEGWKAPDITGLLKAQGWRGP